MNQASKPIFYKWQEVNDLPDLLEDGIIYIIGENGYKWYAAMKCPCSCQEVIYLNLLKERDPYWRIIIKNELISINPSVWRTKNCKSHFVISKGKIVWFKNKRFIWSDWF